MDLLVVLIPFAIVGLAYLVRFLLHKPFYYDPYGKETKRISKIDDANKFIEDGILDADTIQDKRIRIIGDMDELIQIFEKTKDKQFDMKAITGPKLYDEKQREKVLALLSNKNVKIYVIDRRPQHHFAIIGPNILVESPHPPWPIENQLSIGIRRPHRDFYESFQRRFNACLREAQLLDRSNLMPSIYSMSSTSSENTSNSTSNTSIAIPK